MSTIYPTIEALVPAVLAETERPGRMAILRANRQLLTEQVLFGVAQQAADLAKAGESDRAQQAFTFGFEAAAAADHPSALLSLLLRLAEFREKAGSPDAALDALERANAVARDLIEGGDLTALGPLANASGRFGELAQAAGQWDRGRAVMSEARRLARRVNARGIELYVLGNLIVRSISGTGEPDWNSANGYALELGRLLNTPEPALRPGEPAGPEPAMFADILSYVAKHAYESEDFELSTSLARIWRRAAPGDPEATRELALSAMRSNRFAEAEGLWRELLAAAPDTPSLHANLAGSLSAQQRYAEAAAALDRAIELAPEDVTFRRFRVQVKRASGDVAGAVADLSEIIARVEASLAAESERGAGVPAAASRSRLEYERNTPQRDILDFALLERALVYEAAGDQRRALDDLDRIARESDPATAAHALRRRAEIFSARGEGDQALEALRGAVGAAPKDAETVLALGRVLVDRHEDAEAVRVLAALVLHKDVAGQVAAALTPVVERAPSNQEARLVRGFAAETAGQYGIAHDDFSAVLQNDPSNGHLFYRRGRVRLMTGNEPQDEAWNRSLTTERVLDAAFDFARALVLDPADEDARHCLRWLVDRMCTSWRFLGAFHDEANEGIRAIYHAIPTLEASIRRFLPAIDLASRGDTRQALEQWHLLQHELLEIPMPVAACRIDVYIADSLLRLYDVQGALEHLDAGRFLFLLGQPMSRSLEQEAAASRSVMIRESGRPAVVLETELAHVYPLFMDDTARRADLLRIDALGRLGDVERMLQLLDEHPDFEQTVDRDLLNGQINIAARLRDAGRPERALALSDRLEAAITDPYDRVKLLNLRGSIYLNLRRLDEAEADFRAAAAGEAQRGTGMAPLLSLNLARTLVMQERFADARAVLDAAKGSLGETTSFDELTYHWLLAETALGLDELDPAKQEIGVALDLADQLRGTLRNPSDRLSWQGRLTGLYDLALMIAFKAEDVALAFNLVERSRARAYLDSMQTGVVAAPDSASELVEGLEALRARRQILGQLHATTRLNGSTFVDLELLRALASAAPGLDLVQKTSSGQQMVSPVRLSAAIRDADQAVTRLEEQIDAARAAATVAAVATPMDTEVAAALLRAAGREDPAGVGEAVVLVEFIPIAGAVVGCLVMRSGDTLPTIHPVAHPDAVAAIAARAPWGDPAGDGDDSWQPVFAAMMAGAVERSNPGDLLWIVPCGPLHQMPLHATRVGDVPLLERNPVCYSSSASILPGCLERSRGTYASAIVVGDSRNDLPFARAESHAVAARFGVQAVVGDAATEDAFNDLLEAAGDSLDVLHLATHGTFDADDALDSGLELAGDGGSTSRLTAREIVRATLPIDIVTLSACESGRTRVFAGDEPVGLTRAFLTAGASAVLATLWLTSDLSTWLIVERFYDALRLSSDASGTRWLRAQALREASMAVREMTVHDLLDHQDAEVVSFAREMVAARSLQDGDRPFSAPRYWAPFALVGAWT